MRMAIFITLWTVSYTHLDVYKRQPLIFAGLAYTVAKKANLINLGIEGQLYMGALGTSLIALMPVNLPGVIWIPLSLLGGIIFGGLYAGLVGFMKVKFGSNEVIATVMLNTIAQNFVAYVVNLSLIHI